MIYTYPFYPFGQFIPVAATAEFGSVIPRRGTEYVIQHLWLDGLAAKVQRDQIKTGRTIPGIKDAFEIEIQIIAKKVGKIYKIHCKPDFSLNMVSIQQIDLEAFDHRSFFLCQTVGDVGVQLFFSHFSGEISAIGPGVLPFDGPEYVFDLKRIFGRLVDPAGQNHG
ncbi:MAG: hypothetical protein HGJ94_12025 [Desulfosarcina sp.]|nr:hypothetical protein [Desulfosarcina sp.]